MDLKLKIFKGKIKNVEQEVNEFMQPKMIEESTQEHVEIKNILQSSYVTLSGDNGVVMSIFYTTFKLYAIRPKT